MVEDPQRTECDHVQSTPDQGLEATEMRLFSIPNLRSTRHGICGFLRPDSSVALGRKTVDSPRITVRLGFPRLNHFDGCVTPANFRRALEHLNLNIGPAIQVLARVGEPERQD
jgi:hypothetical protein